jgi:beta-phosphoglucomutase
MKPKAIVFDLDGVLWNSSIIHEWAFLEVLKKRQIPDKDFDYAFYAGMKSMDVFKELLPNASEESLKSMSKEKQMIASKRLRSTNDIVNPELGRVISCLNGKYVLGICTSSRRENLQIFLDKSKLYQNFSIMITAEEVVNAKPDPSIYLRMTQELNFEPDQVLVVEDSLHGIMSARSAGNLVVHLCARNCKIEHADFRKDGLLIINTLGSLPSLLELI